MSKIARTIKIKGKGTETTYCNMGNRHWCSEINGAPLNNRGWVLQERMLSPRTLHYASQLFWECRKLEACELFPSEMSGELCGGGDPCLKRDAHPLSLKRWSSNKSSLSWNNVIQSFAQCELTRASDRLVSISGIAKELRTIWRDDYLAGLWRRDLPYCLLWRFYHVEGDLERPALYRCKTFVAGKETILIIFRPILVVGIFRFQKRPYRIP